MDDGDFYRLTPRERDVLKLLAEGKSNKQIAADLCISTDTVRNHTTAVYQHLGIDPWAGHNPRVVAAVMFIRDQGEAQP
jgi:DNA-binding NarL/FixJ family response regulator